MKYCPDGSNTLRCFLVFGRTSLYVPATKQDSRDEADLSGLLGVNADHAAYGYRRLQLALAWSEHKTRRLMVLAGVIVLGVKRRSPHVTTTTPEPQTAPVARVNLLKERKLIATSLHHLWAEDFTPLWFQGHWYYLATVIDLYSRVVVGWALSAHHDTDLVVSALLDALSRSEAPAILHQDQGSEYCSERYGIIAISLGIELSFSTKGHPWENGFQESFYRYFKIEIRAKKLDRFKELGELSAAITKQIQYYNTERIHSALGMSPIAFSVSGLPPRNTTKPAKQYGTKATKQPNYFQQILTGVRDKVFGILGA